MCQVCRALEPIPLKTTENKNPLVGALKQHMWECPVKVTIEAIAPTIIVHNPSTKAYLPQLEQLASKPRLVCVWHPGDRMLNAQRERLKQSWRPLAKLLRNAICQPSATVMSDDVRFIGQIDELPPGRPGQFIVIYERKLDECYGYSLANTRDKAERIFQEFRNRPDVKRDPIRRGPNVGRPAPIAWIGERDGEEWVPMKETEGAHWEFDD